MHTTKYLQVFNSRQLLRFISQAILLLVLSNISSCSCKQYAKPDAASTSINMTIAKTLLVGDENNIAINFEMGDAEKPVILSNFKLKISILEQKTVKETTTGSQIQYKDAAGAQQAFSDTFEKPLTEFTSFPELNAQNQITKFKVDFAVLLASIETVQIKLNVELIAAEEKSIQNIPVEWIKSKMIITPPTKIHEHESSFTLQNLKEDIKELDKIVVSIQSSHGNVGFLVGGMKKTKATLAELIPETNEVAKGEETKPIKIVFDELNDKEDPAISILVVDANKAAIDSVSMAEDAVHWPKFDPNSEIGKDIEALKKVIEKEQKEEYKLNQLGQKKKVLKEEMKYVGSKLEEEERELLEREKETFRELKQEEKKELEGNEDKTKQQVIKRDYKKKKRELLAAISQKLGKSMHSPANYTIGFITAVGKDMFFTPLAKPKNLARYKGTEFGHKAVKIIGGTEMALGSGIIGIGLLVGTVGAIPSFGGAISATVLGVVGGSALVAHGIFAGMRAKANLNKGQQKESPKPNKKRDLQKEKKYPQASEQE